MSSTQTRPSPKHFFEWLEHEIPGAKSGAITYPGAGYDWKVSYRSFFPGQSPLVDALADLTVRNLSGAHALDLYAGVGLFSLPLAQDLRTGYGG